MALLSKSEIFAAQDIKTEDVPVPEWGGDVRLRTLTGRERDAFEATTFKTNKAGKPEQNLTNLRARLISECATDETGKKLFASKADVDMLGSKSVAALQRLFDKCQELNGMSAADVEELAESFEVDPGEDSTSA